MTDNTTPEPMSARTPADVIAAMHAMIGVHLDGSLVILATGETQSVVCAIRAEFTDYLDEQRDGLGRVLAGLHRAGAVAVILATFDPDREKGRAQRQAAEEVFLLAGIKISASWHVDGESITTDHGEQYDAPSGADLAAIRRKMGAPESVDRAEKIARHTPIKDQDVTNQIAWAEHEDADPDAAPLAIDALCCLHLTTGVIAPKEIARYLQNISNVRYRDAVSAAIAAEDAMPNLADALTYMARRAPVGYAPDAYAVAALAYYLRGDTIEARAAADQALAANGNHTLARLITYSLDSAVHPKHIRELLQTSNG